MTAAADLCRQQVEVWKAAQARQPALFDLKDGCRPQFRAYRRRTLLRATLPAPMTARRESAG
jgi:hypothetical protein